MSGAGTGGDLGVGVIGYGYWGRNHVRVFDELEGSRVAAVCDERLDRLEEAARRAPQAHLTTSVDKVLACDEVDAVVVSTPASTHFEVARACLHASKHVLVEKPLTTSSGDAEALTTLAAQVNRVLLVGQTFLYNPGVLKLKEIVASGELGGVYYMYARRTNLGPIRNDVNALWDLAPHDISIFNHLLGAEPSWVSATGARLLRNHLEDVGFISLQYPQNVLAHIHVSWTDPNKVREVVVVGHHKRVLFNDVESLEQVRIFEKGVEAVETRSDHSTFGQFRLLVRDGDIVSPRLPVEEPLVRQSAHFLDCVQHGARPLTGGVEGTAVIRVMESIDRSLQRRGAPVEVEAAASQLAAGLAE